MQPKKNSLPVSYLPQWRKDELQENGLQKDGSSSENFIPTEFSIGVFPNPFNPTTTFRVSLPEASSIKLSVYNMIGQRIAVMVDGEVQAGFHDFTFNGSNLASGMYIYRLESKSGGEGNDQMKIRSGKIMLLK